MTRATTCGRRGRPPDPARRAARCGEILAAAARVFASAGFAATEMQQVADAAGVGKATLYRHFPSKEALFLAALEGLVDGLKVAVDAAAAAAPTPLARIERGITAYLAYVDAHPELAELLVQERATFRDRAAPVYFRERDRREAPWISLVSDLVRRGVLRRVPPDRVTDVVCHALYGTIFTNHMAGRRKSHAAQARDLVDVVFHGILAGGPPPAPRSRRRAGARPRRTAKGGRA